MTHRHWTLTAGVFGAVLGAGAMALAAAGCGGTEPLSAISQANETPELILPVSTGLQNIPLVFSQSSLSGTTQSDGWDMTVNTATVTTVIAPAAGIVTAIDATANASAVTIYHNAHLTTRISKLQAVSVQAGSIVQAGSGVGVISTTSATIHFTVFYDGAVDCPLSHLNAEAQKNVRLAFNLPTCT